MKGAAEQQQSGQLVRRVAGDELRQEGEEEDRELGVEQVDENRLNDDLPGRPGGLSVVHGEAAVVVSGAPGHPEQVGDPEDPDRFERDAAGA